jgi:hypothetical protein
MRVTIVTNADGDIIAVGPPDGEISDREYGGPTHHAFVLGDGQYASTVDLPDELATDENVVRLHETHRVAGRGNDAEVVAR